MKNQIDQKTCIIIGSGIAGVASSVRMANKGYKVKVFEANDYIGGKLAQFDIDGYRFDAGPSVFTMPHFVLDLIKLSNKKPEDYFEYHPLDIACRYFFEDGLNITAYTDQNKFLEEIEKKTVEKKETVLKYFKRSKRIYDLTANVFLFRSLHKIKNYFSYSTLRGILNFNQVDVFKTMYQRNRKTFKDDHLVQIFSRYATYNGSNPYKAPATLNVISHIEYGFGVYIPKKGMVDIAQSLYRLGKDLGVEYHLNSPVAQIITQDKKAIGVKLSSGEEIMADIIISNMDFLPTYRKLLPQEKAPEWTLKQQRSNSGLIFYWGITKEFPELDVHNTFFSKDYAEEFHYLSDLKNISDDPTIYINITSKEIPVDAPEGCENWFVMVNAPSNTNQDWDEIIARTRENIILKLNRLLKTDMRPLIACELISEPREIEARTSSGEGSLYGTSSNGKFAAFLRHPNFSNRIKNLYFCGGSVHPGGGVPMSLLSAKITCELIEQN